MAQFAEKSSQPLALFHGLRLWAHMAQAQVWDPMDGEVLRLGHGAHKAQHLDQMVLAVRPMGQTLEAPQRPIPMDLDHRLNGLLVQDQPKDHMVLVLLEALDTLKVQMAHGHQHKDQMDPGPLLKVLMAPDFQLQAQMGHGLLMVQMALDFQLQVQMDHGLLMVQMALDFHL